MVLTKVCVPLSRETTRWLCDIVACDNAEFQPWRTLELRAQGGRGPPPLAFTGKPELGGAADPPQASSCSEMATVDISGFRTMGLGCDRVFVFGKGKRTPFV